jgi:hypothetical protein
MGKLKYLVLHCTATPEGREVTSDQIRKMHTAPKSQGGRGWDRLGYSDMIHLDGTVENITPHNEDDIVTNSEMTWGASGVNATGTHVVYVGGMNKKMTTPRNTMTKEQEAAIIQYIFEHIKLHPDILIAGHNQFARKACPSFDIVAYCMKWGVPEKNINREVHYY